MNTLNIERVNDYAVIQIDHGRVNAIDTTLVKELNKVFTDLQNDTSIHGAILAGRPNCFSAGLDVQALAQYNTEELRTFWLTYKQCCRSLVRYDKPLVCAITGYAPAGATILTLCTDYRIMAKGSKHVIGMHEFRMSLQIPRFLCQIYAYHLGERLAWEVVQKAQLFNSDEAIQIGLVNESVSVEEVMTRAETHLQKLLAVSPKVFTDSKKIFRAGLLEIVEQDLRPLVDEIVEQSSTEEARQLVTDFLKQLKSKG